MGFNYNKRKSPHEDSGSMWTSYSDLFMALSVIFLLLYVVASLKQSTNGLLNSVEQQKLTQEVEELKSQIRVYNTLKENYLAEQANDDDKKTYQELTDKLSLLQDQARKEKNDLIAQANENGKKEKALNQYQKLVQSIINANMVSQSRIKRRDNIIEKKDDIISQSTSEIKTLEKEVAEKQIVIKQSENKISAINGELSKKIKELRRSFEHQKISKKKFDAESKKIKTESERQVAQLKEKEQEIKSELGDVRGRLSSASQDLQVAKSTIEKQGAVNEKLAADLQASAQKYSAQIESLKSDFDSQRKRERAAFDKELARHRFSAAQKAKMEAEYKAAAAKKEAELGQKISSLNTKVHDTEGQLARARENEEAKKRLIAQIKSNLSAAGVSADVDPKSGDVVLNFGEQYFDTGRADLKPAMRQILEKAMPIYSKSLFQDKKIADKIANVEIMGFASPTYQGKYIDPGSLDPDAKKAVNYNMDLSYERAKKIFEYVFDTNRMSFQHQKELYPLVKVSGRSFLAEAKRGLASGQTNREFCQAHDCNKAQRVIIKFTMKD